MSPEELMAVINVVADTAMEGYYWWATAIMIAIHAGFMMYEMGASRAKNVMHTGVKNILAFAFTIPAFFVVGWWAYWAYQSGNILFLTGIMSSRSTMYHGVIKVAWDRTTRMVPQASSGPRSLYLP